MNDLRARLTCVRYDDTPTSLSPCHLARDKAEMGPKYPLIPEVRLFLLSLIYTGSFSYFTNEKAGNPTLFMRLTYSQAKHILWACFSTTKLKPVSQSASPFLFNAHLSRLR